MNEYSELFIGLDTSKLKISVAVAERERNGEVRFFGDISADPSSVASMVAKLAKRGARLHFCYEAGPTGYDLYRQITELGHECQVVAPSLIPKCRGDRIKTNRRDAVSLARLHRAGELTADWVPDDAHEAMRDLVRARESAHNALKKARQQLQSFLLRHGRIYPGRTPWTRAHSRWLAAQSFTHPAHHIVLAEYIQAIEDADVRENRLTQQVAEMAASWSMAPVVEAYQAMRGIAFINAVTFVVEIGDVRRFETAPQLMAYLGLVPSESSTGERVKRGGITKAGNMRARRVLIEGAWTYRYPARVSPTIQARLEGLPRTVREIAWKGQIRLCARYRKLIKAGKLKTVAVTAIAREMAAFLWAIGQEVALPPLRRRG
jgi:transposase